MKSSAESVGASEGKSRSMDFDKPPVVETSLGFIFSKVPGWNILHFGALWEHFKAKYPLTEFPPPVLPDIAGSPIILEWSSSEPMVPLRTLFTDASRTQLVQIQNNFFLHNWRKTQKTLNYEHYEQILSEFKHDWTLYLDFLKAEGLPKPSISRCEMSYFNHIVRGQDWDSFEDLPKIFRAWRGFEKNEVFTNLEVTAFNVVQAFKTGKVQIAVSPGVRTVDGKEILQMNVTASAVPTGSDEKELFLALGECHQIALKSFDNFITRETLNNWGMKR